MKRLLHIIALILSFALVLAFFQISQHLPGNSSELVEKKYDSWNGVLRAWICSKWRCEGSFSNWLNRCAASFEKEHPGVYIEFTTVTEQALHEIPASSLRPPELLFFSPGIINRSSMLELIPDSPLPVCMGSYIWVINTALCETIPDTPIHLPDDPGRSFTLAAEGLAGTTAEIEFIDPGIDLGLTASAPASPSLDAFINGDLPSIIISQYELAKLIRLREAGKGPDWRCIPSGNYIYTDQLLLGAAIHQHDASELRRSSLARSFLQFLREDECQHQLASIGAFPVAGPAIYPSTSPYSTMEAMLHSLPLVTPEPS